MLRVGGGIAYFCARQILHITKRHPFPDRIGYLAERTNDIGIMAFRPQITFSGSALTRINHRYHSGLTFQAARAVFGWLTRHRSGQRLEW